MRAAWWIVLVLGACRGVEVLPAAPEPAQQRSATIESVTWEEGRHEYEHGIWFRVDFQIDGCYAQPCSIVLYFYDQNRNPLRDRNREYHSSDGTVATMEDFTPGFARTRYSKFGLFIPVNEFHVGPGQYTFKVKASIFWRDTNRKYHHITTSPFYDLPYTWWIPESGEITRLEVDYNRKKEQRNGIEVRLDYSVHGMKGRKGRFVVEFYYELSKLTLLHVRGREEEGVMSYAQEFEPGWIDTDYTGGSYWVPYDLFPLKIGRNSFYFKVWLQAQSTDGKWYNLDATTARDFYVKNGELKLAEVWVIQEQRVLLDWEPQEKERQVIEDTLTEFNRRLYDATDGQVRVRAFRFSPMAKHPEDHYDGAFRIYRDFRNGDHGDTSDGSHVFVEQVRPFAYLGTPDRPGDAHLSFDKMQAEGPSLYSRALVHEFHHAAFGLNDEYGELKDDQGNRSFGSFCARSEALRRAWNSCIMGTYQPLHRELCTPSTHTVDAANGKLHRLDCYTRVQQALKKAFGTSIVIPETPVEGPHDPPAPSYRWK
jgi:hypothetical protein